MWCRVYGVKVGIIYELVSYLTVFVRLFLCTFEDGVADFVFEGAYFNNNINNFIQQPFYSPVRLFPAIGVMSGAHYRTLSMFFMLVTTQRALKWRN